MRLTGGRQFGRRRFVTGALGTAAAGWWSLHHRDLAAAGLATTATAGKKAVSDQVVLGKTGIKLSRLAIGGGTHGTRKTSVQARLGVYGFGGMLVHAFDQGVNFFETADQYGTHEHMREGMRQVGKNNVVLLTKTRSRTAEDTRKDLDRFRRELGREQIDIVLLHCLTSPNWAREYEGAMEVLSRAKEQGIIRAHGVSCHSLAALQLAARTPWVDVDQARINPIGAAMDADPATVLAVLREMKAAGKGIIGMKILGAGAMSKEVDRALAYAAKLDVIDAMTMGFGAIHQFDEIAKKLPLLSAA